jgi:hypothetical protein
VVTFNPGQRSTEKVFTMTKIEAARRALRSVDRLHESFHAPIMAALQEHDVIPRDGSELFARSAGKTRLERVEAEIESNPSAKAALRFALGSLRSHGIVPDDFIDNDGAAALAKLDKVMAAKSIDPDRRMNIKTACARAGLID